MTLQNSAKNKVIIADDEPTYRRCITFILEHEGWEVTEAQNGREAIEMVLKERPNVLILDYQMPELTGAEVYRYLQLHKIKLPVILVSSNNNLEELASHLGITYYLRKPFDLPEFLKTINSAYQNFGVYEEM
ncbi:response regulator [Aetokthonos hydrillicola Thurmond2011]|uniref:Response regulator n=1 Tax=Aetokthonos hydrillicola Thurmond2011 TaxID=2712845 RepID=A0AAP5IF95_9CYAN|nr:response regulator [Aetokthonos hydrillicola]MBO3458000.1 response regulator [Aetokthonos hydrillicola CCALA 1050]MBW4587166.1 response regulator [Aetokthonos hydrillicola CCALA 1050]MDR9899334.1 response regulator [Aetokthonos hydrillicola Thurmond2011]